MNGSITFYNYDLSGYTFTFTLSKNVLTIKIIHTRLDTDTIYIIEDIIFHISSYLDIMKMLKRKLINFKNSNMNADTPFDYNRQDHYIIDIFDMNVNEFIRLKDEKQIEMQHMHILFNNTICTIERNINRYKFFLVVQKTRAVNSTLQYEDIVAYILQYL